MAKYDSYIITAEVEEGEIKINQQLSVLFEVGDDIADIIKTTQKVLYRRVEEKDAYKDLYNDGTLPS